MNNIILFDGDCHFCDTSVQFIIQRDPKARFKFASLQSGKGLNILKQFNLPRDMNSFVYIKNNKCYTKSTAALKVSKYLTGLWPLFYALLLTPKFLRDIFYDMFSSNRYKLFGKKSQCTIPTPAIRKRFL